MRLAGHTNSYHTYEFRQALEGIAAAGFSDVELSAVPGWTEHIQFVRDRNISEILAQFGLTAISLSAHSDLSTKQGVDHAIAAIRWASENDIRIVNTATGGHTGDVLDRRTLLLNLETIAKVAEQSDVVVALETHGDVMASGARARSLIEELGQSAIRINYDTANVEFFSGAKAIDDLPEIVPLVAHVHLKDTVGGRGVWNFPALGEGTVDFRQVIEILAQGGYSGPLSVELEFQSGPWPPLEEVDRAMSRSFRHISELLGERSNPGAS